MPSALYRLGNSTFTGREFNYFTTAIARGYTREQVRAGMQTLFGRGFRNTTFTQARRALGAAEALAERANQLERQRRAGSAPLRFDRLDRTYSVYEVQATATMESATGEQKVYGFNFHTSDNSEAAMEARIAEIAEKGNQESNSQWRVLGVEFNRIMGLTPENPYTQ